MNNKDLDSLPLKEKTAYVVGLFKNIAKERNIEIKLNKKK